VFALNEAFELGGDDLLKLHANDVAANLRCIRVGMNQLAPLQRQNGSVEPRHVHGDTDPHGSFLAVEVIEITLTS
jgi:hypothetical protein